MKAKCQQCGKSFYAQRSTAKFCSATCRSAARGGPRLEAVADGARTERRKPDGERANHHSTQPMEAAGAAPVPSVLDAVRGRLADTSDADWRKAACLRLAYRMDNSQMDTATALGNLATTLEKMMDELAPVASDDDFLSAIDDEVAAKRRRR